MHITSEQRFRKQTKKQRKDRFPIFPLYLVAVFIYALIFSFWQTTAVPLEVHVMAILVAATSFIPISFWYKGNRDGLPIFEVIVLSYVLQFSMPVYTQPNSLIVFSSAIGIAWEDIYRSLWYAETGLASLIIGYYIARAWFTNLNVARIDLPIDPERRTTYLVWAIVGGTGIMLLNTMGLLRIASLSAIVNLVVRQVFVAIILLAYDVFRKTENRPRMIYLLYGVVGLSALIGLITGLLENALLPLVLLFLVRWHVAGRIPWLWAICGLFLYLALNPAKFDYRERVWYGREQFTFMQRVGLWQELFFESAVTILNPADEAVRADNTEAALARFDLIHRFAYVQRLTPDYVPYYKGETYQYFLYAWVPRLIWPNKPSASIANDIIDIDYRLKYSGSTSTIGIGQLPEAYINFGLAGIIGVLALQGGIFAFLDHLFNGRNSQGGRAIYLAVMVYFINGIGSSSAILFGALFQQLLVNALLLRPFVTKSTTKSNDNKPHQLAHLSRPNRK